MAVRTILRLGNPTLFESCAEVDGSQMDSVREVVADLHDTLMQFRKDWGPARAVAAPQIGVMKRIVYMNIGEPMVFLNPVLSNLSDETFQIWDDCMSFPELLVRVERHRSCTITFRDMEWKERSMELTDLSELLQHECDHLDGILAVSRALDDRSIILKTERAYVSGIAANPGG